ncbi:PAN domain-containing protein [Phyllobacterium meliloti]|uniref:PAN domain-containing protein n=1 Tax=Phyllobacterium meliloti TaxID=555317 RepID=UPI001D141132|nr:PAN domain-containing protein [Phyllobacterium sp. T1293]UGX85374.1 PAN domain-containing protein [Phyllobacterium sp. T1293]
MRLCIGVGRLLAVLFVSVFLIGPSQATQQSFGPFSIDDSRPDVIALNGEIDVGTALNFRRVLQAAPNAKLLVLNSPGGMVQFALLIADDVHQRNLATFIPKGSSCYSACAYIFLAGNERQVDGELGVHQISSDSGDLVSAQYSISDIIDVLNRFNTPIEVLTVMFKTPPKDMHVFTQDEVARFHINRKREDPTTNPTVNVSNAPPSAIDSSNAAQIAPATLPPTAGSDAGRNDQALSKLSTIEEYARRPTRMAIYAGLDLFGDDISSVRTSDAAQCAKSCLSMNGQCKAFTFNANSSATRQPNCFLKASEGKADGNVVAISGKLLSSADPDPQQFSMGTIDPKLAIFKDVDLPGGDLSSRPFKKGGTAQQCRLACIAENRCIAFTYIQPKTECWLKGVFGTPIHGDGMITGLKKMQTFSPTSIISLE